MLPSLQGRQNQAKQTASNVLPALQVTRDQSDHEVSWDRQEKPVTPEQPGSPGLQALQASPDHGVNEAPLALQDPRRQVDLSDRKARQAQSGLWAQLDLKALLGRKVISVLKAHKVPKARKATPVPKAPKATAGVAEGLPSVGRAPSFILVATALVSSPGWQRGTNPS